MKRYLRLIGIILFLIDLAIVISGIIIVMLAGPEYNYADYTGFRFPTWLEIVVIVLASSAGLLISYGSRKNKK